VPLVGNAAIVTQKWQHFKLEVVESMAHFYVGDMTTPQMTFPFFAGQRGAFGLQPRSVGGPVWVDNVKWRPLSALSYAGAPKPPIAYAPQRLLTTWELIGPLTSNDDEIGRHPDAARNRWQTVMPDGRGAVITSAITDFHGARTVAYLRTRVSSEVERTAMLNLSTADDLAVWLNGRFWWFVQRGDAAWHDFITNPKHAGQQIPIDLKPGMNTIVIRVRGGSYATGGFFAKVDGQ
jgi:hypothetical protein